MLVGLSGASHHALHALRERLRNLLGDILAGLPPRDQKELVRLLAALGEGLAPQTLQPAPLRARSR